MKARDVTEMLKWAPELERLFRNFPINHLRLEDLKVAG